ncbi:MAG TPA: multicopper oxidase domain-containing protein [Beutenbergiaceae bacterium]|nr:multicopper oxidase domain-containing protein [Beutenbergiaceae bacterium]
MSGENSELGSLGYDRGHAMMGMMSRSGSLSGPVKLASLAVTGQSTETFDPVPLREPGPDLREQDITQRREITFTMAMGTMMQGGGGMRETMGFDGSSFDGDRIDQQVQASTIEEWTITNPTEMDHPFHLHVWPMQVIEQSGTVLEQPTWRDVVNVPAGEQVRMLVDFSPHVGRSVYHCHILDHEDAGMMATVDVTESA